MHEKQLLKHIEANLPSLRRSERKVAEFVLANASQVIHMRIVDLAAAVGVSEPTVVRFCRAVDCDGFGAFKLALAQHGTPSPDVTEFELSELDTVRDYAFKVFDSTIGMLKQVRDSMNPDALEIAVEALRKARRVEFYGFGASASVAIDAQHKFFRLQIPSAAHSDPHIQTMAAMSLHAGDVVVAISQSGRSQALLDAMELVRESGAFLIGLAPGATPVARACDLAIHIDVNEQTQDRHTPLPSRIAHLTVIDILAVGVAKMIGPAADLHLSKIDRGLQPLRTEE